jgi:hypothetical protein
MCDEHAVQRRRRPPRGPSCPSPHPLQLTCASALARCSAATLVSVSAAAAAATASRAAACARATATAQAAAALASPAAAACALAATPRARSAASASAASASCSARSAARASRARCCEGEGGDASGAASGVCEAAGDPSCGGGGDGANAVSSWPISPSAKEQMARASSVRLIRVSWPGRTPSRPRDRYHWPTPPAAKRSWESRYPHPPLPCSMQRRHLHPVGAPHHSGVSSVIPCASRPLRTDCTQSSHLSTPCGAGHSGYSVPKAAWRSGT